MSRPDRPLTKSQYERDLRDLRESIQRYHAVRQQDTKTMHESLGEAALRSFKEGQPYIWERKHARYIELSEETMRCVHALTYIDSLLFEPEQEPSAEQPSPWAFPLDEQSMTVAVPYDVWLKALSLLKGAGVIPDGEPGQGEADPPSNQPQGNLDALPRRRVPALMQGGGRSA